MKRFLPPQPASMLLIHITSEKAAQSILEHGFQERQRERCIDNMPEGVDPWIARWTIMAAPIVGGQQAQDVVSLAIPHANMDPWWQMVQMVYPDTNLVAVQINVNRHLWKSRHMARATGMHAQTLGTSLEVTVDRRTLNSLPMEIKQRDQLIMTSEELYRVHHWRGWGRDIMKTPRILAGMRKLPKKGKRIATLHGQVNQLSAIMEQLDLALAYDNKPTTKSVEAVRKLYGWMLMRQYSKCVKFELDELDEEFLAGLKTRIDNL